MRTFTLVAALALALTACPTDDKPSDTTKAPEPTPELTTEPDVSIFGAKAQTASYTKGKDGSSDRLTLGGVDGKVVSPNGKHEAEMLKIIESNLFPTEHPVPDEGPPTPTPPQPAHAWLDHSGKTTEIALTNPVYSAGAGTLTLDVSVINGTLSEGALGPVSLRVQDCPDQTYVCAKSMLTACNNEIGPVGTCWNWLALNCLPCHCDADMKECVEKNPSCCGKENEPCYPARLGPHGWNRYCL